MTLKEFFVKIGFDVDGQSFKQAESTINRIGDTIEDLKYIAEGVQGAFNFMLGDLASESAEFAKLAEIMGVSAEVAQEWVYATNQVGINAKDMIELTAELAENMGEAAQSATGEAALSFAALGLTVKDANGNLKQTPQFFEEIADAYAKETDARKKANFLTGAFGEQGIAFALLFKNGAEGIRAMRQEAEDLGLVMSEDAIKSGAELARTMTTIDNVANTIKNTLGAELAPVVSQLIKEFLAWWKVNKDIVKQRIQTVFSILLPVLKLVIVALKTLLAVLGFVIDQWRLFALIITTAVIVAMIAYKTQLLFIIGQLGLYAITVARAGYASMVAWIKATAPLLPYVALIAMMLLILDDIWGWWNGKDSLIGRIIDGWKKTWNEFIDAMLTTNPDDPWWLKAIKTAIQEVKFLIDQLRKINPATIKEDTKGFVKTGFSGISDSIGKFNAKVTPSKPIQVTPEQQAAFNNLASGLLNKAGYKVPTTNATTNAKTVHNNQKIEVKIDGAGKDSKAIAIEVANQLTGLLGIEAIKIQESK